MAWGVGDCTRTHAYLSHARVCVHGIFTTLNPPPPHTYTHTNQQQEEKITAAHFASPFSSSQRPPHQSTAYLECLRLWRQQVAMLLLQRNAAIESERRVWQKRLGEEVEGERAMRAAAERRCEGTWVCGCGWADDLPASK